MIEMILVFIFGVLLALIIGFFISPILWRRAEKVALNRIQGTMPLLSAEIEAEKDSYRAEYALKLLQVERELEAERTSRLQAERKRAKSEQATIDMKKDFDQKTAQTQQLQASLSSIQSELVASESHVLELTRQNRDLLLKQSKEDVKIADLKSTLSQRDIAIETLNNTIKDTQRLLDETTQAEDKANKSILEIQTEKDALAADLNLKLDETKLERDEARTRAEQAEARANALDQRLNDYVNKAREQGEQISQLKDTLQNQESAFAKISKNYARNQQQLSAMCETVDNQNKEDKQKAENLEQLKRERETFESSLKKLAQERDKAVNDYNSTKQASADLEKARTNEISALRQSLDTLGKQKIALQSKFEETLSALKRAGLELVEDDDLDSITRDSEPGSNLRIQERGSRSRGHSTPLH